MNQGVVTGTAQCTATEISNRYMRAERFLPWNAEKLVHRAEVNPQWLDDDTFWYQVSISTGQECVLVNGTTGTRELAFDHVKLARLLSVSTGEPQTHTNLNVRSIRREGDHLVVCVEAAGKTWTCDLSTDACSPMAEEEAEPDGTYTLQSPDGKHQVISRDNDLWFRDGTTKAERPLTTNGTDAISYGRPVITPLIGAGLAKPDYRQFPIGSMFPAAVWSPDGTAILTHRLDESGCGKFHLIQSVPLDGQSRPLHHEVTYPLPGDETVPQAALLVIDAESGSTTELQIPSLDQLYYGTPLRREEGVPGNRSIWWSHDSSKIYVLRRSRGFRSQALYVADAKSGVAHLVVEECSDTPIDPNVTSAGTPAARVTDDGSQLIWFSQRDGWGHLYLYDVETAKEIRQLTSGAWAVADVVHVDDAQRYVYFTAVGREVNRDPYYHFLYRVSLDGGDPELLTDEDADHAITFSPSGAFFVDTYSRVDKPPITILSTSDGRVTTILEEADISLLLATGWQPPERFKAKARDGVTDVYGVMIRPSTFECDRAYPVVDSIYAGPQVNQAPTSFADIARGRGAGFWQAQAIAELGFIVVMIDGLGMPFRSKQYHDISYRNLGDGGLPDHIAAIRQLAERYPYIDVNRVGIYGHSAGGYASCRAIFAHPDFYKVCVSSAGNHDHRLDKASWVERYMGYPVGDHYEEQANQTHAHQLKGKLLLIHGEMDENVNVASTLVVVDALIKANKDFDLLIMPNRIHACGDDPYFIRRRWDYFVTHLAGETPPPCYQIMKETGI